MFINKRVAFLTLGCKVNQYETEGIKQNFLEKDYTIVNFNERADIYIINTCTVTSIADRKSRNMIRRAKRLNPNSIVVATGCYAQTDSDKLEKIKELDLIIGNLDKYRIEEFIENRIKYNLSDIFDEKKYQNHTTIENEKCRAFVKIQDGCDNFCSFCKIPFGRGRKRSRELSDIIVELEKLARLGFKEIVLIGINLSAYGEDLIEDISLNDVLEKTKEIDGIERIRLGSIYPDKIDEKLIHLIKNSVSIMPHLHISMQSGDTEILKLMNRKYTADEAKNKLLKIKTEVPNISLTGDFIVGFPGENKNNFENTRRFIEDIGFSDIHIFKYSDREKTKAKKFKNKVSSVIKKERADILDELRQSLNEKFLKNNSNIKQKILIEEVIDTKGYGFTENYIKTSISNYKGKINEIIETKIETFKEEFV